MSEEFKTRDSFDFMVDEVVKAALRLAANRMSRDGAAEARASCNETELVCAATKLARKYGRLA